MRDLSATEHISRAAHGLFHFYARSFKCHGSSCSWVLGIEVIELRGVRALTIHIPLARGVAAPLAALRVYVGARVNLSEVSPSGGS